MKNELSDELTNIWSLLHATAAGCISVALWEGFRMVPLNDTGHLAVYVVAAVALIHSVKLHRSAVSKRLTVNED
jgi:hypothetical protein